MTAYPHQIALRLKHRRSRRKSLPKSENNHHTSPLACSLAARRLPWIISHANVEQYKTALEHISVRAGTAIPTGAAEEALAALYQHGEDAWPFLKEHLTVDDSSLKKPQTSSNSGAQANGTEDDGKGDADGEGEERPVASQADCGAKTSAVDRTERHEESGAGQKQQHAGRAREKKRSSSTTSSDEAVPASFRVSRLSVALEAFARACGERGSALEGSAIQDLTSFLYLSGQAKVGFQRLGGIKFWG